MQHLLFPSFACQQGKKRLDLKSNQAVFRNCSPTPISFYVFLHSNFCTFHLSNAGIITKGSCCQLKSVKFSGNFCSTCTMVLTRAQWHHSLMGKLSLQHEEAHLKYWGAYMLTHRPYLRVWGYIFRLLPFLTQGLVFCFVFEQLTA